MDDPRSLRIYTPIHRSAQPSEGSRHESPDFRSRRRSHPERPRPVVCAAIGRASPRALRCAPSLPNWEKAGYNPNANDTAYPANIQAAQAKVARGTTSPRRRRQSAMAVPTGGSSASGRTGTAVRTGTPAAAQAVYFEAVIG